MFRRVSLAGFSSLRSSMKCMTHVLIAMLACIIAGRGAAKDRQDISRTQNPKHDLRVRQAVRALHEIADAPEQTAEAAVLNLAQELDLLVSVAESQAGRRAILDDGDALEAVVHTMASFGEYADVLASGCNLISVLCMGLEARAALARLGAVELVVSMINVHSEHPVLLEQACGALINLAIDRGISVNVGAAGGIRGVLQSLAFSTVGSDESRAIGWVGTRSKGMHHGLLKMAMAALANLAAVMPNADLIAEEDGVYLIVEAMELALEDASGEDGDGLLDVETQVHAADLLRNLAESAQNRQHIVDSGGVQLLARLIPSSPSASAAGLGLMAKLLRDSETLHGVFTKHSIPLITAALGDVQADAAVQESACLLALAALPHLHDETNEQAHIPGLALLDEQLSRYHETAACAVEVHSAHAGVATVCRELCGGLMRRRRRDLVAAHQPIVEILIEELQSSIEPGRGDSSVSARTGKAVLLEMACDALTEVVDEVLEAVSAGNASAALVEAMHSHRMQARVMHLCCMSVWQLATADEEARRVLNRQSAASVLVSALHMHSGHPGEGGSRRIANEVLDSCMRALVPLAQDDAGARELILQSRSIAALNAAIRSDEEEGGLVSDLDVQEQACRLIDVVAATSQDAALLVVQQGALHLLVSMVGNKGVTDGRVREQACTSLSFLLQVLPPDFSLPWASETDQNGLELVHMSNSIRMHSHQANVMEACTRALLLHSIRRVPALAPAHTDIASIANDLVMAVTGVLTHSQSQTSLRPDTSWVLASLLHILALLSGTSSSAAALHEAGAGPAAYAAAVASLRFDGGEEVVQRRLVLDAACEVLWVMGVVNQSLLRLPLQDCFWSCQNRSCNASSPRRSGHIDTTSIDTVTLDARDGMYTGWDGKHTAWEGSEMEADNDDQRGRPFKSKLSDDQEECADIAGGVCSIDEERREASGWSCWLQHSLAGRAFGRLLLEFAWAWSLHRCPFRVGDRLVNAPEAQTEKSGVFECLRSSPSFRLSAAGFWHVVMTMAALSITVLLGFGFLWQGGPLALVVRVYPRVGRNRADKQRSRSRRGRRLRGRAGEMEAVRGEGLGASDHVYSHGKAEREKICILFHQELSRATDGFHGSRLIGTGASGEVFLARVHPAVAAGQLERRRGRAAEGGPRYDSPDKLVAVKRLRHEDGESALQRRAEFVQEMLVLGACSHVNLMPLLAFSAEPTHSICLVFPLMTGGNLEDRLLRHTASAMRRLRMLASEDVSPTAGALTWQQRLHVLLGAGRALAYLHETDDVRGKPPILHRDVKAANVLLDGMGNAKLADAGLARLAPELQGDATHISSANICGTHGFVDPAYQQTGRIDASSDGYALGVCMLMCVTGWAALDASQHEPVLVNRCHEVLSLLAPPPSGGEGEGLDSMIREIADVEAGWPVQVLKELLRVAQALLHPLRARRINMSTCVASLEALQSAQVLSRGAMQTGTAAEAGRQQQKQLPLGGGCGVGANKECVMCLERVRQVRFDGCGHAVVCGQCHQQLLSSHAPQCPMCGGPADAAGAPDDAVAGQATFVRARG